MEHKNTYFKAITFFQIKIIKITDFNKKYFLKIKIVDVQLLLSNNNYT